ncbi:hypothetical protein AB205_0120840 [Aquarana catesbeiana]|uniref:Uncharacterized protein n=1 Tax=Aquarana catesbeiana TaxID=8400 RepID=A0A2G9REB6_AQUCT|nr:hypothetical protein AB205_0120840 [Aquarana catesbeiana]
MNPWSLLRRGSLRSVSHQSPKGRVLRQDWLLCLSRLADTLHLYKHMIFFEPRKTLSEGLSGVTGVILLMDPVGRKPSSHAPLVFICVSGYIGAQGKNWHLGPA